MPWDEHDVSNKGYTEKGDSFRRIGYRDTFKNC